MRTLRAIIFLAALACCLSRAQAASAEAAPVAAGEAAATGGKVLVIQISDTIGSGTEAVVKKAFERANSERPRPRLIVLEIDTPGGYVASVEPICDKLLASDIPTVALVTKQAISGGSMVATACREIVMVEGSTIGDCEPHNLLGDMENMREKIETKIRADMRTNAQRNNYPPKLLEAMVTKSIELYQITYSDKTREFLFKSELELLEKQIANKEISRGITGRKLIVEEGRLLTLTAREALEYGLAKEVISNVDAFYSGRGIAKADLLKDVAEKAKGGWSVQLMMVLIFCLTLGLAGAVIEFYTPGFGVAGSVAVIGFACFFAVLFLNGRASPLEIGLFVIGLGLVLAEIFILPGFGVAGILGVACVGLSLVLSLLPPLELASWSWQEEANHVLITLGGASIIAILLAWILAKYWIKIPLAGKMVLVSELRDGGAVLADVDRSEAGKFPHEETAAGIASEKVLKGVEGVAATVLRPAGKMRADDGRVLDVVSDGGMIQQGERVRILEVNGPRITVVKV